MTRRAAPLAPPDLDGMVAVASGPADRVSRWSGLLTGAAVPCAVARPCGPEDFAELWVPGDTADEARAVLRGEAGGEWLIW